MSTPKSPRARGRATYHLTWTADMDALLGTLSDHQIAARLQCAPSAVAYRRKKLGIAPITPPPFAWTPETDALLGKATDKAVAQQLGIPLYTVGQRRRRLGIAALTKPKEWLKHIVAKAGSPVLAPEPETPAAPTERRFDIEQLQHFITRGAFPDTENKALTAYLEAALAEVLSTSLRPPPCTYCQTRQTILAGKPHARLRIPAFYCPSCKRGFNRRTGTPLVRLHYPHLMPAFVRLLSQQLPYQEACRRLGVSVGMVVAWTVKFRRWLLQLDPSGEWEAKVRLGMKPRPVIRCPRCADENAKYFHGYSSAGVRQLQCQTCHAYFDLADAERLAQQRVRLELVSDDT